MAILINKDLKGGVFINEKNFPHLFAKNDLGEYEQVSNFYINFNGKDFEVETTLDDTNILFEKIKDYLTKRKKLMLQAIEMAQKEIDASTKELESINDFL